MTVTLGMARPIGLAALAVGLVAGVSTGIGYREQYDYKSAVSSQHPPAGEVDEPGGGGNPARVLLPGADVLVTRAVARLYAIPTIRSQLMCRVDRCSHTLDGPVADLRGHYLHSGTQQVVDILRQPAAWRPMGLREHLVRAHELRAQLVQHLPADANPIKNRTFETLISELERRAPQRRTA